ncbi:Retrovirus-related Pol polyprotein [Thelohanellus kitauei]|uniref:Retrovirus-related Pol polyprotein n=1 Tax=Thelohanellus kitauei TaxID=669202 RepID=A0A0C2M1C3_THEKT|nr:Retrovirus-related Pol polyprotein [Thelohanellus kitauei]
MIVDSGSGVSLVRYDFIKSFNNMITPTDNNIVKTANDGYLKIIGSIELDLILDEIVVRHVFGVSTNLFCDCLLGTDFLKRHSILLDFCSNTLVMSSQGARMTTNSAQMTNTLNSSALISNIDERIKKLNVKDVFKLKLRDLILSFKSIFSNGEFDVGRYFGKTYPIRTIDSAPIKQKVRRISWHLEKVSRDALDCMLQVGIIKPGSSPWASPIVIVPMKNGAYVCIDYQKLNKISIADAYPLPRRDSILDSLSAQKYFLPLIWHRNAIKSA